MSKSKEENNSILNEFLYRDKLTLFITIIGAIILFVSIFKYDFPVYLIYIFMFSMMAFSLYRYVLFIKKKDIKSQKTEKGVIVEMGNKKWLEPKRFFSRVGIFLLVYYSLVGAFYYFSRMWGVTQFLILIGFIVWGWLIKKGTINKK